MTSEEFRALGHRIVDWVADYRDGLANRPVMPSIEPGAIRAALPRTPPQAAEPFEDVLDDVDRLLAPALMHWQHPRFFGFFPSNASLPSVLGDYLSTGLGALGLSWQSGPALTELEEVVVDWVRQMLGLSEGWRGVIQDTASTSTLVALIAARERSSSFSLARGGLQSESQPLVVYVSTQSHSSVEKAALLAGFGRANLRSIPTDSRYAMRPDALGDAIGEDRDRNRKPCAIVATTGTTASTALDPLAPIAGHARAAGVWLHVDAAMAGSAMILPECRWMWDGIEGADSLVVNVHKWLGAAFDCSLFFVRDPEHLVRVMSTNPSYLQSGVDARVTNYRDWGIPLGRRFRALKLWSLIREQGVEGLQSRLRRDLGNARWLQEQIEAAPGWRLVAPAPLQTLCVRHEPDGLTADALDSHTRAWVDRVNRSGQAYLTSAVLDGRWMVRVSIGALPTEREHVEELWTAMQLAVAAD